MNLEGLRLNETSQSRNDIALWEPRKIRITPSYPLTKPDTLWFKGVGAGRRYKGNLSCGPLTPSLWDHFPNSEDSKPRVLGPAHTPKVPEARAMAPPPLPGVRRLRGRYLLKTSSRLPATVRGVAWRTRYLVDKYPGGPDLIWAYSRKGASEERKEDGLPPQPPGPWELMGGHGSCVPTEGAGTSAELRRKAGVLGDLASDSLAPFRADASSQSCLWQGLVVGRPGGRAGAPGKLGGLLGCRQRGFFEPRVCDSLVYLEIRISPLKEVGAADLLNLTLVVKLPVIPGSNNVFYTTNISEKKTIEKQGNKLFDSKTGYDNCENAYFQQWLLQKNRQAASDQELLTKHRKIKKQLKYPLNDGGIKCTSPEAPSLSATMENVVNHPPQDIKK
ncbi:uncharacterized protein LOC130681816 [Manis pentadactyla]|uniref:uncharacterized protein LOC130681816 n=1 Tax=Manis pentadactyla TaxID=143292 RepID=UPI00255CC1A6|nr:uncharacterized protein LOC130681816 [Manis pentadactyla]